MRWRQVTINTAYIAAFFKARDEANRTGKTVQMIGFPNKVHPIQELKQEIEIEFVPNKR